MQNHFGLIGRTLKHSFSKGYFTEKFEKLGIENENQYHLFELAEIDEFPALVQKFGSTLKGLNVTIPYKQAIMPFLDEIDEAAQKIGAVNTIKIITDDDGKNNNLKNENSLVLTKWLKLKGYNSDYWGFRWTIEKWDAFQEIKPKKALILGKGGAAKAVIVALNDLGLEVQIVSRKKEDDTITYDELTQEVIDNHLLIVNSTPLGMYPNVDSFPEIPYNFLSKNHLLYDLVYNPLETEFLKKGKENGIKSTHSGLEMLHGQAEKAWEIWGEE
jgi:shikimate dehydrogenase